MQWVAAGESLWAGSGKRGVDAGVGAPGWVGYGNPLYRRSGVIYFFNPISKPLGFLIQNMDQDQSCDRNRNNRVKNCQHEDINQNLGFCGHTAPHQIENHYPIKTDAVKNWDYSIIPAEIQFSTVQTTRWLRLPLQISIGNGIGTSLEWAQLLKGRFYCHKTAGT